VLVSHDSHPDNLDDRRRAFALAARLAYYHQRAGRLSGPAIGLAPWTSHTLQRPDGGGLTMTAVPAIHGPEDGERDAEGFINCAVIGFVLSGANLPTVYLSGDNASIRTSAEIAQRIPDVDVAVLHAGAARVPGKFRDRPVSMDSIRTAAAAVLGASDHPSWVPSTPDGDLPSRRAKPAAGCSAAATAPNDHSVRTQTIRPLHHEHRRTAGTRAQAPPAMLAERHGRRGSQATWSPALPLPAAVPVGYGPGAESPLLICSGG
jgi:hypothetical protein